MLSSKMSFRQHFQALRKRVTFAIIGLVPLTILSFVYWKNIWYYLHLPLNDMENISIINTHPTESFILSLKISILSGFILSFPWIIWNFWKFISPGLTVKEQRIIIVILPSSFALLLSGILFSYAFIIPHGLQYLASYNHESVAPYWTQKNYLNFILQLLFAFGITFQMPIIALALAKLNICTAKILWKGFRFALPIIFIVSAILTPPDPTTQLLLAVPLCGLYLLCIFIVWIFNPQKK